METVTLYQAEDGQQFKDEDGCLKYEQQCIDLAEANGMFINGATLMAALNRANLTRPWWDETLSLEDKVMLTKITKDTGVVVRHWQCSDKPRYKPIRLDHNNRVQLWGEAESDIGPGEYGNGVSLAGLLRYARDEGRP